jgi:hypothetical protein
MLCLAAVTSGNRQRDSLLQWDGYWYRYIAARGYDAGPPPMIRFFPGFPLAARALAWTSHLPLAVALLVIANACAFVYSGLVYRLARREGLTDAAAARAVWVLALGPAAFVLVMAYAEALYGLMVVTSLLALRRRRWLVVAGSGFVAAACRAPGVLLALAVLVEVWSCRHVLSPSARRQAALAALGPVLGLASFVTWSYLDNGDPLRPLHAQNAPGLREGVIVNPLDALRNDIERIMEGDFARPLVFLHVLWLAVAVALFVRCARRMPASFTVFAGGTLLLAATAANLGSFERYVASAVPLLLVAGEWLAERSRRDVLALAAGVVTLGGYSLATFSGSFVP